MRFGVTGMNVHLPEVRSEVCCKAKLIEGTVQLRIRLTPETLVFNTGAVVPCHL